MKAIKLQGFADSSCGCLFLVSERKHSGSKVKMKGKKKSRRFALNIPRHIKPTDCGTATETIPSRSIINLHGAIQCS